MTSQTLDQLRPYVNKTLLVADQPALEAWAASFADHIAAPMRIGLSGPLGAGKTTLARALIRALCHDPHLVVPSPTFSIVQFYDTPRGPLYHLDLYRLGHPNEVIDIGWDDMVSSIVLIEWPDQGGGILDLHACLEIAPHPDKPDGRYITLRQP